MSHPEPLLPSVGQQSSDVAATVLATGQQAILHDRVCSVQGFGVYRVSNRAYRVEGMVCVVSYAFGQGNQKRESGWATLNPAVPNPDSSLMPAGHHCLRSWRGADAGGTPGLCLSNVCVCDCLEQTGSDAAHGLGIILLI